MATSWEFKGKIGNLFSELPSRIDVGVKVTGPAAAYALIWELGAFHLNQPGPKTMYSTNMLGDDVILTIQAPHGYVRVNRRKYIEFLQQEFKQINWNRVKPEQRPAMLKKTMIKVANRCLELIKLTVPVDTHQLQNSLEVVNPGDNLLKIGGDEELQGI